MNSSRSWLVACALTCQAWPASADELPPFRKGLWEFNRSVDAPGAKPGTLSSKRCTDPTETFAKNKARTASKKNCTSTPLVRSGANYTSAVTCMVGDVPIVSSNVVTVVSDSEYRIVIDSKGGGTTAREVLLARRVGDCP